MRPIVVLPHDKVPSATEFTLVEGRPDWPIGTRNDKNHVPRTYPLALPHMGVVLDVRDALERRWTTDAMFTPYRVEGIWSHHPRVDKPGRDWLAVHGTAVWFEWIIIDFDNPGHEAWKTHEESIEFLTRLAACEMIATAYRWATRSGARVMWPVAEPIDISDDDNRLFVEGHVRGLMHQIEDEYGLQPDFGTANVGRVQRPPHVVRKTPFGRRPQERPKHVDHEIVPRRLDDAPFYDGRHRSLEEVAAERERQQQLRAEIRARMEDLDVDDAQRLQRAEAYLDEMDPCISGVNGNINATRAARVLIESFDLDADECATIMTGSHWNAVCAPPWDWSELYTICRTSEEWVSRNGRLRGVKLLEDRQDREDALSRVSKMMSDPRLQFEESMAVGRFRAWIRDGRTTPPSGEQAQHAGADGSEPACGGAETEDSDPPSGGSEQVDQKEEVTLGLANTCADPLNYHSRQLLSRTATVIQGDYRPHHTNIWQNREVATKVGTGIVEDESLQSHQRRLGWELINYANEVCVCCDPKQREVIEYHERREVSDVESKDRKLKGWRCKHAHFCPRCAQTLGAKLGRELAEAMRGHRLVAGAVTYALRAESPFAMKARVTEFIKTLDRLTNRHARVAIPVVAHSVWGDEFVMPVTVIFLDYDWDGVNRLIRRLYRWEPPWWAECMDPRMLRVEIADAESLCIHTHNMIPEWATDPHRMAEGYMALKGFNRRRLNRAALDLWEPEDPPPEEDTPEEARHDEMHFRWEAMRDMSDERHYGRCYAYLSTFRRLHHQHEKAPALPLPVLVFEDRIIDGEAAISAVTALSNRLFRHGQRGFTTLLPSGLDIWDLEEACLARSIHSIELDRIEIAAKERFKLWSEQRRA